MNNCCDVSVKEVCDFLKLKDNFAILTHASPDGDCLGSAFALADILKSMGKAVKVFCPDKIPEKFSYFAAENNDEFNYSTVISVDVADEKLLGDLKDEFSGKIDLAIDHHISNKRFAKALYLDKSAAAACECIYDIATMLGASLTQLVCDALYTGIATDTGCFKYSNTTPKTHILAAKLIEMGADFAQINRVMFDTKSRERLEIERLALENADFLFDGKAVCLAVTRDMVAQSGCTEDDLDGLSVLAKTIEGISVAATMREKENGNYKVSLRTYDEINAAEICGVFGGGGHKAAAGCVIEGPLENAKDKLYKAIKKALEKN